MNVLIFFMKENHVYKISVKQRDSTTPSCKPIGAIKGKLHDGGVSYMVICYNGERGSVPGRSDGKKAWFSMDGKEYETDDFVFVSLQGM